jgi:hypothetical protein
MTLMGNETLPFVKEEKTTIYNSNRVSRRSGLCHDLSLMSKTSQNPLKYQSPTFSHAKINSSIADWNSTLKSDNDKLSNQKDEIRVKSICKSEFIISNLTELSEILANKKEILRNNDINDPSVLEHSRSIVNYKFAQNEVEICISVIGEGSKDKLQAII